MLRINRLTTLLVATLLSLGLVTGAVAQKGKKAGSKGIPQAWLVKLNLNADQQGKVKSASDTLAADLAAAKALSTPKEKRQASKAANDKFTGTVSATLNEDQKKLLATMRAEAAEFQAMGPAADRMVGLNLSDEQKTKIKAVAAKYDPELDKLRAEQKGATDKKAVQSQIRDVNQKMVGEISQILNDEQRKQFSATGGKKPKKSKKIKN